MSKPAELRDQTDEQLELLLKDVQNNLFRLRLQSETERLEAPSEIIKAKREIAKDPAGHVAALQAALAVLKDADWKPETLERALRELAERRGVASGKIFQPIRIALTGGTVSEPVNELLYVVGKDAALKRLAAAATGSP